MLLRDQWLSKLASWLASIRVTCQKTRDDTAVTAAVEALRWIALLPVALLAGWLGSILLSIGLRAVMVQTGVDPDSLLSRVIVDIESYGLLGAVVVYVGGKVAPTIKIVTCVLLATAVIVIDTLFVFFPALVAGDTWPVLSGMAVALGSSAICYSVLRDELRLE